MHYIPAFISFGFLNFRSRQYRLILVSMGATGKTGLLQLLAASSDPLFQLHILADTWCTDRCPGGECNLLWNILNMSESYRPDRLTVVASVWCCSTGAHLFVRKWPDSYANLLVAKNVSVIQDHRYETQFQLMIGIGRVVSSNQVYHIETLWDVTIGHFNICRAGVNINMLYW